MKKYKLHMIISLLSFVVGMGIFGLLICRIKIPTTIQFVIYAMLSIVLVINMISYITIFFRTRKSLGKKVLIGNIGAIIYSFFNVMLFLLYAYTTLVIYLFFIR